MDVHRSRFVPHPVSAISALAFSRSNDSGYSGPLPALKLAVGRANGNIEIWNPQQGRWLQEAILPGNNTSIDGLAWTQDPYEKDGEGNLIAGQQRLFSIASSPDVTEWDLATGQPKRRSTGNFSEVWCLAAQPISKQQKNADPDAQAQDLIAGCGDGTIVLLSTADGDLQFKRFLARVSGKKARCMCVTYQNRDRVVAGFADSMIRIYDTRNGSLLRTMSLGVSIPGAPKNALVWQVKCLPNGDIVSGDSNGEVKFWDGKTYSLAQRISGHESDCLDMVVSNDGKTVMSGSIDGKMAIYRQSQGDHERKTWARSSHRRLHNGETKAMASFDAKGMSVVVSGGSDMTPVVTPLREYGKENVRSLPTLPHRPPVASATRARLLVSWWDKSIYIWRVAKQSNVESVPEPQKPRKLVARIGLDTKDNIQAASITPDGRLLAVSTSTEVKVFQLRKRVEYDSLAVRKLDLPDDLAVSGAHLLHFSHDGKWLASVTPDSEVYIARCTPDPKNPKHLQVLSKVVELERHQTLPNSTAFKAFDRTITQLAFSSDNAVLVASDRSGHLDSWVLEGHEDSTAPAADVAKKEGNGAPSDAGSDSDSDSSDDDDSITIFFGQHWTDNPAGHLLPKVDSQPLILTFRPPQKKKDRHAMVNGNPGVHSTRNNPHAYSHELPQGRHRLWILTAKHQMFEFDVLAGRLSDWSRRNPTAVLPEDFTKIRDRVMGAVWDVDERLWLYGSSFVCMLNVGVDLAGSGDAAQALVQKKKRKPKRGAEDGQQEDDTPKRRKLESGAGGRKETLQNQGIPSNVKRYEDGAVTEIDVSNRQGHALQEDDDDEEDDDVMDLQLARVKDSGDEKEAEGERKWWCTFKYRPILGMVPLSEEEEEDSDEGKPLEVVIVERPLWDVLNEKK